MPIITPVTDSLKDAKLSTEVTHKSVESDPLGLGADMSDEFSPPRNKYASEPSPSKLVLPRKIMDDDSSTAPSEDCSEDASASKIIKTEHKLFEESDAFEEPLLKENPHRFVLFPIQDNDVSTPDDQSLASNPPVRNALNSYNFWIPPL